MNTENTTDIIKSSLSNITRDNLTQVSPQSMGLGLTSIIIVSLQLAVMILVLSGNSLVIFTYKTFPHLQTVTGKFIVNLALADFVLGLSLPFQVMFFFIKSMEGVEVVCMLRYQTVIFTSMTSLMSLLCAVFDRCVAIFAPLRYHAVMSDKLAYLMITFSWMYALLISSFPLFGLNMWTTETSCIYELVMTRYYRIVVSSHFIVLSVFMFSCYTVIYLVAWQHRRRIAVELANINCSKLQYDAKMAQVMACVMLSFALCWLPFCILQLMQVVNFTTDKAIAANFAVFIGVINSAVNPFIYAWKNCQYRRAFKKILGCHRNQNQFEQTTLSVISY